MINDTIINVASDLFKERMRFSSLYMNSDDVLKDKDQVERHADTCITLAKLFYERAEAILPPLKPFEILNDKEDEADN